MGDGPGALSICCEAAGANGPGTVALGMSVFIVDACRRVGSNGLDWTVWVVAYLDPSGFARLACVTGIYHAVAVGGWLWQGSSAVSKVRVLTVQPRSWSF